jgi:predicted dehydrogenase
LRALIVGHGRIGRRHLRNLRTLSPSAEITVLRRPGSSPNLDGADRVLDDLEVALHPPPDLAVLAGPAPTHVPMGQVLCEAGAHLFVEKPLSHTMAGVDELLAKAAERRRVLLVGYCLRFHGALRVFRQKLEQGAIGRLLMLDVHVGQYLPLWRPDVDYRRSVSARRESGGGVLLELSHELDYARWLAGEVDWVSAQAARVGDLEVDVEDQATIALGFASGARGCVHLDMLDRAARRGCRAIGTLGTIEWDAVGGSLRLFTSAEGAWADVPFVEGDMYLAELEHFLACVRGDSPPLVTGADARRTLGLALAASESAREQRVIQVDSR